MKKLLITLLVFSSTFALADDYPKQTYVCAAYYWKVQTGAWPDNSEDQLFGALDDGKKVELIWRTLLYPKPSAAWCIANQAAAVVAWDAEIVQAKKSPEQVAEELRLEVAALKVEITKLKADVAVLKEK